MAPSKSTAETTPSASTPSMRSDLPVCAPMETYTAWYVSAISAISCAPTASPQRAVMVPAFRMPRMSSPIALARKAVRGDAVAQHAAQLGAFLEHRHAMPP